MRELTNSSGGTAGTFSYQVTVGHRTLRVESASAIDAIQAARRQLCADLPRLWDVIQSLDDARFHVTCSERRSGT